MSAISSKKRVRVSGVLGDVSGNIGMLNVTRTGVIRIRKYIYVKSK